MQQEIHSPVRPLSLQKKQEKNGFIPIMWLNVWNELQKHTHSKNEQLRN